MTRSASPLRTSALGLAAVGALALSACGSDDGKKGDKAAPAASAQPAAVAITVQPVGKKGGEFEVPGNVEGGVVTITLDNQTKLPREAQLIRAEGDHSAAEIKRVVASDTEPIPNWVHAAGGAAAEPKTTSKVTTNLVAGTYYVTDTSDPDFEGTPAKIKKFTVTAGSSQAKLPTVPAQITAVDYGYEISNLKAGRSEVHFQNTGKEIHHALFFPMTKNATIADVSKFLKTEGKSGGPPPFDFKRGVTSVLALDGGTAEVVELEFKAGRYAAVCFVQDRAGGPPHFLKGMISEVTVQ